jgi:hypothetical protein
MNRLLTTLLLTSFCSALFSQQVLANRPGADEMQNETNNTMATQTMGTQAPAEAPRPEPSAVENMMHHESHQSGDVVMLPGKEIQPGETIRIKLLDSPRRGMSMENVKNQLGQPGTISASVGTPPITRWVYSDRVVYFENSTVLHVVAR